MPADAAKPAWLGIGVGACRLELADTPTLKPRSMPTSIRRLLSVTHGAQHERSCHAVSDRPSAGFHPKASRPRVLNEPGFRPPLRRVSTQAAKTTGVCRSPSTILNGTGYTVTRSHQASARLSPSGSWRSHSKAEPVTRNAGQGTQCRLSLGTDRKNQPT
jgi:hypothetical protein